MSKINTTALIKSFKNDFIREEGISCCFNYYPSRRFVDFKFQDKSSVRLHVDSNEHYMKGKVDSLAFGMMNYISNKLIYSM